MTGQRRDLNREKFKAEKLTAVFNNPDSNANKNLKYLSNAMDIRSRLPQFHPNSKMQCLSKSRGDIVVIKRGIDSKAIFTIHNMTENKINYRFSDYEYTKLISNELNMQDYLTSNKYNSNNIELDPFQVIWLGFLIDD